MSARIRQTGHTYDGIGAAEMKCEALRIGLGAWDKKIQGPEVWGEGDVSFRGGLEKSPVCRYSDGLRHPKHARAMAAKALRLSLKKGVLETIEIRR